MSRLRQMAAPVIAAILAAAQSPTPAAAATASVADGALFNKPHSGSRADQYRIPHHIAALVRDAAPGSDIRIAVYTFTLTDIADDLIDAKNRGVSVRVIVDSHTRTLTDPDTGQSYPNPAYVRLTEGLGTDTAANSWAMHCTPDAACIGTRSTPINHNKVFLFSESAGSRNVVIQGSANLTNTQAKNGWNNAVTLVGNTALYDSYQRYFDDLAAMNKTDNYYRTTTAGFAKTYIFPRAGTGNSTDTIYNILGNVDCASGTKIRLAMYNITRTAIASRLWTLDDQGCHVQVLYTDMSATVRTTLTKAGGAHGGPAVRHSQASYVDADGQSHAMYVHSKYLLIDGKYYGTTGKKLVFTGSPNYTYSALRENDEVLIKLDSPSIHGAFNANFTDAWNASPAVRIQRHLPLRADLPPQVRAEADPIEN